MFVVAVVIIIYDRELFTTYQRYDLGIASDPYSIQARYLRPPLPPIKTPTIDNSIDIPHTPIDDEIRYYESPAHYNPMNWNCRFQGHVSSSKQHRIFELCNEGVAARDLLAVLVGLQALQLLLHAWAWWAERKGRGVLWLSQRLGSEEQVARPSSE